MRHRKLDEEMAVMTFKEIGRALGITPQGAQYIYRTGMAKLSRGSRARQILELARMVEFKHQTHEGLLNGHLDKLRVTR